MAYKVLKSNNGRSEDANRAEVLIESSADLANLPENLAPGSVAYTADMSYIAMKAIDGAWKQIGA